VIDAGGRLDDRGHSFAPLWVYRSTTLLAVGIVLAVAGFQLWITPSNPPGFLPDEASMSYNAYLLSQQLRDENGGLLPLYVRSFGDYKSPMFTYTLAAVFRTVGPHSEAARALAAAGMLTAVLLLGLLARRRTGSNAVAVSVVVLAGLTPYLFEVGRAAYEVALEPAVIALLLLAVDGSWRARSWTVRRGLMVGIALTGIAYVYAAGRLLAPLFALALLVFAGRGRWRWLSAAWATFAALAVVPIGAYWLRHPGALTQRYEQTTFIDSSMAPWTIVSRLVSNYAHDLNLWHWITAGDPKPYVHTWNAGSIFASVVALAAAGAVIILARHRHDLFWRYALVLFVLAPIPAALTNDRFYGLRLVPLPVLLTVLAMPALAVLWQAARTRWAARALAAALAAAVAVQFGDFLVNYRIRGPQRTVVFHSGVPTLLAEGFHGGRTIYVDYDEPHALVYARWYAVEHGIAPSRVVRLPDGGIPPSGAVVFGRFQGCDFSCRRTLTADDYWIAEALGPKPTAS
jgi:hypothetical protein